MTPFCKASSSLLALMALPFLLTPSSCSAQVQVFSSGNYLTPETIFAAPSGFGTRGGQYFIPDAGQNNLANAKIYAVPANGGAPSVFASGLNVLPVGGLFLPSGWGSRSGNFLTTGFNNTVGNSQIVTYSASGASSLLLDQPNSAFASPLIAPANFGGFGGQLLVTDENGKLLAISPTATVSTVATIPGITPFGILAGQAGFGATAGKMLISNTNGSGIDLVSATGTVSTFSNISLSTGQSGLRQMAFAPGGFLAGFNDPLLFASVSGSTFGGGTLGDIVALDGNGNEVASLRNTLGLTNFDPRGLLFLNNQQLLVSDTSGRILLFGGNAFQSSVPEPGAVSLLGAGGVAAFLFLRRKRSKIR